MDDTPNINNDDIHHSKDTTEGWNRNVHPIAVAENSHSRRATKGVRKSNPLMDDADSDTNTKQEIKRRVKVQNKYDNKVNPTADISAGSVVVQVSRQTLSEYQAAKYQQQQQQRQQRRRRKTKNTTSSPMVATQITLEENEGRYVHEPEDTMRNDSWKLEQILSSNNNDNNDDGGGGDKTMVSFTPISDAMPNDESNVVTEESQEQFHTHLPNVPSISKHNEIMMKKAAKRIPSTRESPTPTKSQAQKDAMSTNDNYNKVQPPQQWTSSSVSMQSPVSSRLPPREYQVLQQPQGQPQKDKDIYDAYQRLRSTPNTNRHRGGNHIPMTAEDMKMGQAMFISQNHTSRRDPPPPPSSSSDQDFRAVVGGQPCSSNDDGDDSSDDLTLLRDDDSTNEDEAEEYALEAAPTASQPPSQRQRWQPEVAPVPSVDHILDESTIKAKDSHLASGGRRGSDREGLPTRSEHGTNSTRVNPRRRGSTYPILDDDPQLTTQRLEQELIRKYLLSSDSNGQNIDNDEIEEVQGRHQWPSALAYDPNVPGAHGIAAPAAAESDDRRQAFERYDSYLTNQDQYLVTATVVEEEIENDDQVQRKLARERSERFRQLENRQTELEEQIEEQKRLIETHNEELNRLKATHGGDIVQAQVVGQTWGTDEELDRRIRQRESIIAEKEAELQSMMGLPIPGLDILRRQDQKNKEKKRKGRGGKGGLISKLNPFRKNVSSGSCSNNFETIKELDENSTHSARNTTTHSKHHGSSLHTSQHSPSNTPLGRDSNVVEEGDDDDDFNEDESNEENDKDLSHKAADSSGRDTIDNGLPASRETLLQETKKRSDRYIAPEKLPFEDSTISELKQIAEESNLDISGCVERNQIVGKLLDAGVKPRKKGPLKKFFSKATGGNNALGKSSKHSPKRTPKTENTSKIHIPEANMPTLMVNEKRESFYLPKQSDMFEGISISQLKKIARDRNIDVSTCTDRSELVSVLYAAGMRPAGEGGPRKDPLKDSSVAELKRLARANNVDISSCVEKGQIVGALNIAGVRSPKKPLSSSASRPWESMSISDLKKIARDGNVDVSMCVEKKEIVSKLRRAGLGPGSPSGSKKAAPRLSRSDFAGWRPTQLRMLATQMGTPLAATSGGGDLLSTLMHTVNEEKKCLRTPIRTVAPMVSAPLARLRSFAKDNQVDISGCVERDEIFQRIIQKLIR